MWNLKFIPATLKKDICEGIPKKSLRSSARISSLGRQLIFVAWLRHRACRKNYEKLFFSQMALKCCYGLLVPWYKIHLSTLGSTSDWNNDIGQWSFLILRNWRPLARRMELYWSRYDQHSCGRNACQFQAVIVAKTKKTLY